MICILCHLWPLMSLLVYPVVVVVVVVVQWPSHA